MEELFGVPTQQLLWILLAVFGAGALILGLSALRNRVSFRMAARNLPRRRTQTILVVLGLMLATMLFSASFTTGDTLTNSSAYSPWRTWARSTFRCRPTAQAPQASSSSGKHPQNVPATSTRRSRTRCATGSLTRTTSRAWLPPPSRPSRNGQGQRPQRTEHGRARPGRELHGGLRQAYDPSGKSSIPPISADEIYLSADAAEGLDVGNGDVIATFAQKPARPPPRTRLRPRSLVLCPFRGLRS